MSEGSTVLQRVAAGDQRAVGECIQRYGGLVWSLTRRYGLQHSDAEDIVQEVFLELWRHAGRYDPRVASEAVFVATIARRRLIDRLRRNERRPTEESIADLGEPLLAAEAGLEEAVDVDLAARTLRTLRPEQRQVIELGIVAGLSHAEIAEATGMPLGSVKSHMRRGLSAVRERMVGGDGDKSSPLGAVRT